MEVQPAPKDVSGSRGHGREGSGNSMWPLDSNSRRAFRQLLSGRAPGIEESIALAESFRDHCSVHMAILIEHRPYVLDYFRLRQCSFDLVLGFHADMLHGMETLVQSQFTGKGQG